MTGVAGKEAQLGGAVQSALRALADGGDRIRDSLRLLADSGAAIVVLRGAVDVFAVRVADSGAAPEGAWMPIARARAGEVVLGGSGGADHGEYALLCRAAPGSHIVEVATRELYAAAAPDVIAAAFAGPLEQIAAALHVEAPPRTCATAAIGDSVDLVPGGELRVRARAGWIEIVSGTVGLHGRGDERRAASGSIQLHTPDDWITAAESATVRILDMASVLGRDDAVAVVRTWMQEALATAATQRALAGARDIERMRRRSERDAALVGEATRRLEQVLAPEAEVAAAGDGADPSFAATALVCADLGIEIVPPPSRATAPGDDPIALIARSSRFRTRVVRLDGKWWTRDAGPLVAFRRGSLAPVALRWRHRRYFLTDPATGETSAVDEAAARDLEYDARELYPPLPERPLSGWDLIRFAARGLGGDIAVLVACSVVVAALGLLTPILTGHILGDLVPRAQAATIEQYVMILFIGALAAFALTIVQNLAALRIEGKVDLVAQAGIWDRLLSLPTSFFRNTSIGVLSTAALGVNGIRDALSGLAVQAVLGCVLGLANLGLMYWHDPWLATVALGIVAFGAAVSIRASVRQIHRQRLLADESGKVAADVFQLVGGVAKLRVAAAEDRAFAYWSRRFSRYRSIAFQARSGQNMVTAFNAAYVVFATLTLFWFVGVVQRGEMDTATFLTFNVAFLSFLGATLQLTGTGITVLAVVPLFEHLQPILDAVPEVDATKLDPGDLEGRIELAGVDFRYSADGPQVLHDVSLRAEPGEFVALVGPSGCGKSTVLRLLLGFEQPESGTVLYDGQNLDDLDAFALRRQCGVVLQHGQLFSGDIKSNIIGSGRYTDDDAWAAAEMAGLKDDIEHMPMGMHTLLSEGAGTLSGGQRQRLMIARALISKPRVVFFDEATSALDNRTQEIVTESMASLNATRIVIAHRLSTIRDADRIVVMEAGRVVQTGTYDELMRDEAGLFHRLAARQVL